MAKKAKKSVKKSSSKKAKTSRDLAIHFMPYSEISREDTISRIKKLMGLVLENKIIILQGRLKPEEETKLIENSMTLIGNIKSFAGVELAVVSGDNDFRGLFEKVRHNIARILVGEKDAITIIGPAAVVKEITRDPKKLELMLKRR